MRDGVASQAMDLVLANIRGQNRTWLLMVQLFNLLAKKTKKDLPDCHLSLTPHQRMGKLVWPLRIPEQTVSAPRKPWESSKLGQSLVAKTHKTAVYQGETAAHL